MRNQTKVDKPMGSLFFMQRGRRSCRRLLVSIIAKFAPNLYLGYKPDPVMIGQSVAHELSEDLNHAFSQAKYSVDV